MEKEGGRSLTSSPPPLFPSSLVEKKKSKTFNVGRKEVRRAGGRRLSRRHQPRECAGEEVQRHSSFSFSLLPPFSPTYFGFYSEYTRDPVGEERGREKKEKEGKRGSEEVEGQKIRSARGARHTRNSSRLFSLSPPPLSLLNSPPLFSASKSLETAPPFPPPSAACGIFPTFHLQIVINIPLLLLPPSAAKEQTLECFLLLLLPPPSLLPFPPTNLARIVAPSSSSKRVREMETTLEEEEKEGRKEREEEEERRCKSQITQDSPDSPAGCRRDGSGPSHRS